MLHEWFDQVEVILPESFRPGFRKLAESHDYQFELNFERSPMELMPPEEIEEFLEDLPLQFDLENVHGECALWRDWNGGMAVVYLQSPLFGHVSMRDHLYVFNPIPVAYRSLQSFFESMEEAAKSDLDWYQAPTDYYIDTEYYVNGTAICKPPTEEDIAFDRKVVRQLRAEYQAAEISGEMELQFYCENIIGITPPYDTADILELMDVDDMYVQAHACDVLGNRKFQPAITRLGEMARTRCGNGQTAAVGALGKIGTPEAREQILRAVSALQSGLDWEIANALKESGCKTEKKNGDYLYQLPNSEEWHKIEAGK